MATLSTTSHSKKPYVLPFIAFIALMMLGEAVGTLFKGPSWFVEKPQYWVKPAQTLVCGALLAFYWHSYDFSRTQRALTPLLVGVAAGAIAFALWIAPQFLWSAPKRTDGFDPTFFGQQGWPYWLNLGFRFLRLVVVVPLIEEIFWRGFLMRWMIRENFATVPFGAFQVKAFAIVALMFMLEHASPDYPAAFLTGLLYNGVAVRTKSLGGCVIAHATTNLMLGFFILRTEQWGFW